MNIINKLKRVARTSLVLGAVAAAVVGTGLVLMKAAPVEAATSCDKVNVIYCGVTASTTAAEINNFKHDYDTNVSGHASSPTIKHDYHDVQTIYNYVGASKTLVDSMSTSNTVAGVVHRDGRVTVGSKVVATNAKVAARFSVPGAVLIPGTNAYLRTTTSSFAQESEPALIREDATGKMLFAAVIGCGNAVKGTPTVTPPAPKPAYTINKLVAVKGSTNYVKSVTGLKPGTHVTYKVTVASTGNAPVLNLNVKDALPAHVSYVAGTLKRDNVAASTSFFSTGVVISSLKNGTSTVFTFEAIVGPTDTVESCTPETLNNVASMTATGLPGENSNATVAKICAPKPTYSCTSLNAVAVDRTTFNFNAKAAVTNGATIVSYNFAFGDKTTKVVTTSATNATAAHSYAAPGTYNATVSVTVALPGLANKTVTSYACATTVTVKPAPPTPAYSCTNLDATQANRTDFTFAATATATNGATISAYIFAFGDGANKTVTSTATSATAAHSYAAPGTYNATVSVIVKIPGKADVTVTSPACATTVKVKPAAAAECTSLQLIQSATNPRDVSVTAVPTTSGGATLTNVSIDWNDGTVTNNGVNLTANHTYQKDDTYTVVATLSFSNGSTTLPTATCSAKVTVSTTAPICGVLTLDTINDTKTSTVKSLTYTANDATYQVTDLNWGDNSTVVTANDITGQSYQYSGNGPFTVVATVHFTLNGADTAVTCQTPVSFTTKPVVPPTLVNTGAGSTIGLFAGVTAIGAIGYQIFARRRLSN